MAPMLAGVAAATLTALGAWIPVLPPRLVDAVADRFVNATAETLASRRGVRLRRPIVLRVLDRPHMRAAREALSLSPRSPEAERDETTLHALLGLENLLTFTNVPKPVHPARKASDVSGLYDAVKGQLLMGNWVDLKTERFALARDVACAVLDRRFDLQRWSSAGLPTPTTTTIPTTTTTTATVATTTGTKLKTKSEGNSDAALARQALIEGDAAVQALEHVDPRGLLPPPRALAEIIAQARGTIANESTGTSPLGLGRRLFAELDGLAFVARIRERSPWSAVDTVWAVPPRSTEQILHPEKYEKREEPDELGSRLPLRLPGQWQVSFRDTLGELGARIFLTRAVDDYRAERGATGWGGDVALLLRAAEASRHPSGVSPADVDVATEGDSRTFAAWVTTWDDDTDAEDFSTQSAHVLASLAGASIVDDRPPSGRLRLTDMAGRVYALDRRHRTVGMLFAAPKYAEATLSALMAAATARAPRRGIDRRSAARH